MPEPTKLKVVTVTGKPTMLTLYHTPLSINSRRVWVTLLEKNLDFETVEVDLGGD